MSARTAQHGTTRRSWRFRRASMLFAAVAVAAALWTGCGGSSQCNVILITVDTLRADRMGCYGYYLDTSPAIDRMAAEAVVFENAYSQASSTCPSVASFMTSRLPAECGVINNQNKLKRGVPTLAETLKNNGFTTAAFVSNYVLSAGMGFERGFEIFDDKMETKELNRDLVERTADDTIQDALTWLDSGPEEPYFLWIHFQDPHGPYTPPERYSEMFQDRVAVDPIVLPFNLISTGVGGIPRYQRIAGLTDLKSYTALYLGEVRYIDDAFGRFYQRLQETGISDSSIIIFASDHGEGLGEHDYYFAHGEYLYQHQINVPLILKAPGLAAARVEDPVALLDLFPTLLGMLDIKAPAGIRGTDLTKAQEPSRPIFSQTAKTHNIRRDRLCIIRDGYKLIYSKPGDPELYNLADDPDEQNNLADKEPALVKALLQELVKANTAFLKGPRPKTYRKDEDARNRLKSLGY